MEEKRLTITDTQSDFKSHILFRQILVEKEPVLCRTYPRNHLKGLDIKSGFTERRKIRF